MAQAQKLQSPFSKEKVLESYECPESDHVLARFTSNLQPSSEKRPPVTVVLIGLGRMGSLHLANLMAAPNARLKYAVESDPQRLAIFKESPAYALSGVKFLASPDEALADSEVEAVIVASPTATHEDMICKSIDANKHVFCEKPLAKSLQAIRRCYDAAKAKNKQLFCAFNRRFDPSIADLWKRTHAGEVGPVQLIKFSSKDSPTNPIEYLSTSGGTFLDSSCHDIDLMTFFVKELPEKVYVAASKFHPELKALKNEFDTLVLTLNFPSGAIGVITLTRHSPFGHDHRIEVFGQEGLLTTQNRSPVQSQVWNKSGIHSRPPFHSFFSFFMEAYQREMEHFLGEISKPVPQLQVVGEMTLATTKICLAFNESADTGLPVNIEWAEEEIPAAYKKMKQ